MGSKAPKTRFCKAICVEECQANAAYEAYRAREVMKSGRRFGRPPDPCEPPQTPAGKVNLTDPDSRNLKTTRGYMQSYNVQAAVNERQIVVAAEITLDSPDFGHLGPMVDATRRELDAAAVSDSPHVALADAVAPPSPSTAQAKPGAPCATAASFRNSRRAEQQRPALVVVLAR